MPMKIIQTSSGEKRHINTAHITQIFDMAGTVRISFSDGSYVHVLGDMGTVTEELKIKCH